MQGTNNFCTAELFSDSLGVMQTSFYFENRPARIQRSLSTF